MRRPSFLSRPVAAACAAAAAAAVSASALLGSAAEERRSAGAYYAVTLRDHGVDAREMERSVAIPLEDALSSLRGSRDVRTASEYGKVRASVRFPRLSESSYDAVREAAQRVFETLSPTAQRPEILSSEENRAPAWTAAATAGEGVSQAEFARILERTVKPALERIEGAGEVELAGTGLPEIVVSVDEEAAAPLGVDALAVARALASADGLFPAGMVSFGESEYPVTLDGRYPTAVALAAALLPSASRTPVPLGAVARVETREREGETLSRVDGQRAAVVSVVPRSDADLGRLSAAIAAAVAPLEERGLLSLKVLSDRGAEEAASYRAVLTAALQGAAAVALVSALLTSRSLPGDRRGGALGKSLVCAGAVPFTLLASAALLSAAGFPPDKVVLAALAAGIGAAVDAAVVTAERVGPCRSEAEASRELSRLLPSQIAGAATSLVVLFPLASLEGVSPGALATAAAMGTATVCALLVSAAILPPLLLSAGRSSGQRRNPVPPPALRARGIRSRAVRRARRLLAAVSAISARTPAAFLVPALILSAAGAAALVYAGADVGTGETAGEVYAHVEFESGSTAESVDRRLAEWTPRATAIPGVRSVQTGARAGSGSALVSFDEGETDRASVASALRASNPSGGFVYVAESAERERSWEIVFSGDDDRTCRRLAAEAARALSSAPFVLDAVLNFKDGGDRLLLSPDRERVAAAGLSAAAVAESLRRKVHGPVAYKRVDREGETDVRVLGAPRRGAGKASPDDVRSALVLAGEAGSVLVAALVSEARETDVSRIHRIDRRRVASITIRTRAADPRRIEAACAPILAGIELPPLYAVEFDRDALERARSLTGTAASFALALFLCYLVLGALGESFVSPLIVLSAVPPSLAVPALLLVAAGRSVDGSVACAFVAVAGLAVNAAVLTVDEWRSLPSAAAGSSRTVYRVLRARAASLAAVAATTVSGSLPLLFVTSAGSASARSLAFVTVFGVLASFFAAVTVVPALAVRGSLGSAIPTAGKRS